MTHTFNENVEILGTDSEVPQLLVRGAGAQSQPLQIWQMTSTDLAQLTANGRMQVGDFTGAMATEASLIEVFRGSAEDTSRPRRGLQITGELTDSLDNIVSWSVHELALIGANGVTSQHTTLRVRLSNDNFGGGSGADLRGADLEVSNSGGTSSERIQSVTGLQIVLNNESSGYIEDAYGLKINVQNQGDITSARALHINHVFDIQTPGFVPDAPPIETIRLYSKSDGHLYAKTNPEAEYQLSIAPTPEPEDADKFLQGDGTWQSIESGVISVGLSTDAPWLTIYNSPITDEGTIELNRTPDLDSNKVLATPDGFPGEVELRSLVANDIPNLDAGKITWGIISLENGGTGADLSETGGENQIVKQSTSGGNFTVGVLTTSEIPWSTPGTIGSEAPDTGAFTSLSVRPDEDREFVITNSGTGMIYGRGAGIPIRQSLQRVNGSFGSETTVQNGDILGVYAFGGFDGSDLGDSASIVAQATQLWSSGAHGTQLMFYTTANGQGGDSLRLTIGQDGSFQHLGSNFGIRGVTPVGMPPATDDIKDSLQAVGLLHATDDATPLNLNGGALTAGAGTFSGTLSQTGTNTTTALISSMSNSMLDTS